jgi:hypothetical protein
MSIAIKSRIGNLKKVVSRRYVKKALERTFDKYYYLSRNVFELNNIGELRKVFGWKEEMILERPDIFDFNSVEDRNERRIRDAESLATVMRNAKPKIALEIGTSSGLDFK